MVWNCLSTSTVEVREWISNSSHNWLNLWLLIHAGNDLSHVSKRGPRSSLRAYFKTSSLSNCITKIGVWLKGLKSTLSSFENYECLPRSNSRATPCNVQYFPMTTIDDRRCWGLKQALIGPLGDLLVFLLGSPVMEQCPVTTLPNVVKSPRWIIWYHGSSRYSRTLQSAITASTTAPRPSPGRCVSVTFPPVMGAAVGCRWRKRQAILVWCCFYQFLSSIWSF